MLKSNDPVRILEKKAATNTCPTTTVRKKGRSWRLGEIAAGLHKAWGAIKHIGSSAVHKAVKLWNWARKEECEKMTPGGAGCNSIGNTANTCEVVGFSTLVTPFPEATPLTGALGKVISGTV